MLLGHQSSKATPGGWCSGGYNSIPMLAFFDLATDATEFFFDFIFFLLFILLYFFFFLVFVLFLIEGSVVHLTCIPELNHSHNFMSMIAFLPQITISLHDEMTFNRQ